MSRVDPLELLKAIAPMLGHSGNIKSTQEVEKVISLMKETSKLPGRCVYLSILRATSHRDVLELFVQRGGWNVLNEWLQDFRQAENMPSMRELLRLFKDMPVSVDVLKQNNTPKIVNKLTKGDDEDVKTLALAVVQTWMNIVKGVSNGPSSAAPEKKISESKSSKDKSKSQSDKKLGERHKGSSKSSTSDKHRTSDKSRTHNSEKQKDKSKPSSKGSSEKKKEKTSELEDVKPLPEPKVEPKKPVRDRPKTVKTFHARFRSTGLEEEANTAVTKKQDKKRPSESDLSKLFVPSDKKIKPANLITPYEAPKTSNGSAEPSPTKKTPPREDAKIKLIPAKPKPIILESTGFMDALSTPISAPIRRKRKPSTQDVKKPTASPTASIPKVPSFYKDTMEETTEPDQKKPKNDEGEAEEEMEETAAGDKGDFGTTNENSSESSKLEGPVSVLSDVCKKKKCKKSVSWAEETELRNYHYFEMNDDERVNVNKAGTFMDLKHQDMQRERKALDSAKRILLEDKMQEQISWRLPPLISGMSFVLVDRGCNSTERELQAQRETQVLASLYFSKDAIPLSPLEPDPSREEQVDPIVVPLDDSSESLALHQADPSAPYDPYEASQQYGDDQLPPADTGSLPPAITNLLASLQQGKDELPTATDAKQTPSGELLKSPDATVAAVRKLLNSMKGGQAGASESLSQLPESEEELTEKLKEILGNIHNTMDAPEEPGTTIDDGWCAYPEGIPRSGPPRGLLRHPGLMGYAPGMPAPRLGPGPGMYPNMRGPMMMRGRPPFFHRGPRPRGFVPRQVCRNFVAPGGCRFGDACHFLHPGINGPPL